MPRFLQTHIAIFRVYNVFERSIGKEDTLVIYIYIHNFLKLAFINERPEFGVDPRWSESGDCYVLKLFRDYVFHQADESGRPVMNLGHVVII